MAISIRDALGLVRLLYAARRAQDPTPDPTSDPLVAIGRELHAALDLAHHEVGSLGHRAAGDRASRALGRLAAEVTMGDDLAHVARVALGRVTAAR